MYCMFEIICEFDGDDFDVKLDGEPMEEIKKDGVYYYAVRCDKIENETLGIKEEK